MHANNIAAVPASWKVAKSPSRPDSAVDIPFSSPSTPEEGSLLPDSFLDGKLVRTVHGPVPLAYALDWAVFASYDELAGFAAYMGGRIPTFEETRSIYAYAEDLKKKDLVVNKLANNIPAVNGYLILPCISILDPANVRSDTSSTMASRKRLHQPFPPRRTALSCSST